jgi:hypothetical protein
VAELYPVLKPLCDLFSLDKLLEESSTLLEAGFANGTHLSMIRDQVRGCHGRLNRSGARRASQPPIHH